MPPPLPPAPPLVLADVILIVVATVSFVVAFVTAWYYCYLGLYSSTCAWLLRSRPSIDLELWSGKFQPLCDDASSRAAPSIQQQSSSDSFLLQLTPRAVTSFAPGAVKSRASTFGSTVKCSRKGSRGIDSDRGSCQSTPHSVRAQAGEPTALESSEIYRVQYRDLASAVEQVRQAERGDTEQYGPSPPPRGDTDRVPTHSFEDASAELVPIESMAPAAAPRNSRQAQLPPLALGMLPTFDARGTSSHRASGRPTAGARIRLPPLPITTMQSNTDRSMSASGRPQSPFASPSLIRTPCSTQSSTQQSRRPGMAHGLERACSGDAHRSASFLALTSVREYDSHSFDA